MMRVGGHKLQIFVIVRIVKSRDRLLPEMPQISVFDSFQDPDKALSNLVEIQGC